MSKTIEAWAETDMDDEEFLTWLRNRGWAGHHTPVYPMTINFTIHDRCMARIVFMENKELAPSFKRFVRISEVL